MYCPGTLVVDVYGCPVGTVCAPDFAIHLANGAVASTYLGCYQSYGWDSTFTGSGADYPAFSTTHENNTS